MGYSWPLLAYVWLESQEKRTRDRQERAPDHALLHVLPLVCQYVVYQPHQHHHHHHQAHQEPQDHSEPQDLLDQLDFQDQQEPQVAQDPPDPQDPQEHQLDPQDPLDQLDQMAHQDHWVLQHHHHHHHHHHHAQQSASLHVSQPAQLRAAHRRNIRNRTNSSAIVEWMLALFAISCCRYHELLIGVD